MDSHGNTSIILLEFERKRSYRAAAKQQPGVEKEKAGCLNWHGGQTCGWQAATAARDTLEKNERKLKILGRGSPKC